MVFSPELLMEVPGEDSAVRGPVCNVYEAMLAQNAMENLSFYEDKGPGDNSCDFRG